MAPYIRQILRAEHFASRPGVSQVVAPPTAGAGPTDPGPEDPAAVREEALAAAAGSESLPAGAGLLPAAMETLTADATADLPEACPADYCSWRPPGIEPGFWCVYIN